MADVQLPKSVFGVKVNQQAMFDAILSERASRRQGTRHTLNKGEVSGTGKKPWAQKGTGRARAGSLRSVVFVGGAAYGGNHKNNWTLKVNKKVKKLAINSALTEKAKAKAVVVKDIKLTDYSTKTMLNEVKKLKLTEKQKVLFVTDDKKIFKSASNLDKVFTSKLNSLTVEAIVNVDVIVFSKKDIEILGGKK